MHTIYLGLGSNIEDRLQFLHLTIKLLKKTLSEVKVAPIYETKPWGYTDQPPFLNTALFAKTALSPEELLIFVKGIEKKVGRQPRFRNGPREIDIDILLYDDLVFESKHLHIPHLGLATRDTALQPLVDLNPNLVHPKLHKTVQQLLADIPHTKRFVVKKIPTESLYD